jgi:hypothetical protein
MSGTRAHKEPWKNFLQSAKDNYQRTKFPAYFAVNGSQRGKWDDTTANGLTKAITEYLDYIGGAFTRVNTMGTPRKGKDGRLIFTPSTTVLGTADIVGCYMGRYVAIEVKIGADRQSDDQIKEEARIKRAGGIYFIAKTFPNFLEVFNRHFCLDSGNA